MRRLRRPRFTIGRLMVFIAVCAIVLGLRPSWILDHPEWILLVPFVAFADLLQSVPGVYVGLFVLLLGIVAFWIFCLSLLIDLKRRNIRRDSGPRPSVPAKPRPPRHSPGD